LSPIIACSSVLTNRAVPGQLTTLPSLHRPARLDGQQFAAFLTENSFFDVEGNEGVQVRHVVTSAANITTSARHGKIGNGDAGNSHP
jgi:hypothetical protein